MPDDQKLPEKKPGLSKVFKEFSFDEESSLSSVEPAKRAPPASQEPARPPKLTKEDMDFKPYRGMGMPSGRGSIPDIEAEERIEQEEAEAWRQHEWEERQERIFEAAGSMFRHNHDVTNALSAISNLEMQSVIAAGILWEQYEHLPAQRVDDMMIAALVMDAANFDDICGELSPDVVGMVDELHRMAAEPEEKERLLHARSLEPDSKRVLLANVIADLEMTLHEMHDAGDPGPSKQEHDQLAPLIAALAPGVDRGLRERAVAAFNVISTATDNGTTLKEQPDGSLSVNPFPDIVVKMAPSPKPKKNTPPQPGRRPPQR